MKIKKLIGSTALALTLALGVGAALSVPHALESKAATSETTFYVDVSSSFWGAGNVGNVKIHLWGESTGDVYIYDAESGLSTIVVDEVTYVSFSIASHEGVSGVDVYCWDRKAEGNISEWKNFSDFSEGQNLITVGSSGSWTARQPVTLGTLDLGTTYTITQYAVVDGVKEETPIGTDSVLAGHTYTEPNRPYRENYVCYGWYSDEACSQVWDDTVAINADTPIYAYFEYHGPWAGDIVVDLGYKENATGWATGDSNFAIYFATADWAHEAWSSYTAHEDGECLLEVPYSVPFEPSYSIIVKYASSVTEEAWNEGDKWALKDAQSENLWFASHYALCIYETSIYAERGYPSVESGIIGAESWSTVGHLSDVQSNGSRHTEYYHSVYLTAGENEELNAFKVVYATEWYGNATWHASLADNFENDYEGNIIVKVTGTYAVYFDTYSGSVYITTEALAAADEWAKTFLAGVTCDGLGNITSEDWTTLAGTYGLLGSSVKAVFLGIAEGGKLDGSYAEQAVARYDFILNKYGTKKYSDFMERNGVNGVSYPLEAGVAIFGQEATNNSTMLIAVVSIVALTSLSAVAILVVIKRRKHN